MEKSTGNEDVRTIYIDQSDADKQVELAKRFKGNGIRTSKYSVLTFLPLNLYTQFRKAANMYFLVISYMQTIRSISISNGVSAMAFPLSVVVLVSMLKDAFEDYKRHKADDEENSAPCEVYDVAKGEIVKKQWKELKPGQIVRLLDDQFIPVDMLLLRSSDDKGGLYIETKNLDGETNLKNKTVEKQINSMELHQNWNQLTGAKIVCEKPNNAIYKFEGYLELPGNQKKISLGAENFILRGCKLRNTEWVYGIGVFTGDRKSVV